MIQEAGARDGRQRLINVLKILISLGLLIVILIHVDVDQSLDILRRMRPAYFVAALILELLGVLVRVYRWGVLVRALGVSVSWRRLLSLYFVGSFFNLVLPTGVGGDAVRIYELSEDGPASAAMSSVLVERFLGLFTLFALALVALVGSYQLVPVQLRWFIAIVFALGLIGIILVLQGTWLQALGQRSGLAQRLGRIALLRDLYQSIQAYSRPVLLRATAAAFAFNLILVLLNYLLGQAVGIDLPLGTYFLFVPIIAAVLMVPSIGGLGVRESAYVLLFSQVGIDQGRGLALALSRDLLLLLLGLLGVIIYVTRSARESWRRS